MKKFVQSHSPGRSFKLNLLQTLRFSPTRHCCKRGWQGCSFSEKLVWEFFLIVDPFPWESHKTQRKQKSILAYLRQTLSFSHLTTRWYYCRKEKPFQVLKRGSCLILRNELSEETQQETLLGRGAWAENSRMREPREKCSALCLAVSGFMVIGLISRLSLANYSDSGTSWWCRHCSAKMDASEEESGRGRTWRYLLTFLNSSGWWWHVSSVFFTRTVLK